MKDDTAGVTGYDFGTVGVLALREVERTYKHTFGYSLGYLHTSFEMDDNNNRRWFWICISSYSKDFSP